MNPSTSKAQIPLGPRQSCMYSQVIYWTSLSSYILTWIGTALLLHYYYKRRGENKIRRNLNKLHLQNSKAVKTKKVILRKNHFTHFLRGSSENTTNHLKR
jgi:hypothetical protein